MRKIIAAIGAAAAVLVIPAAPAMASTAKAQLTCAGGETLFANQISNGQSRIRLVVLSGTSNVGGAFFPTVQYWCAADLGYNSNTGLEDFEIAWGGNLNDCIYFNDTAGPGGWELDIQTCNATKTADRWGFASSTAWPAFLPHVDWIHNLYATYNFPSGDDCLQGLQGNGGVGTCGGSPAYQNEIDWSAN